jgi:hypothetical protein
MSRQWPRCPEPHRSMRHIRDRGFFKCSIFWNNPMTVLLSASAACSAEFLHIAKGLGFEFGRNIFTRWLRLLNAPTAGLYMKLLQTRKPSPTIRMRRNAGSAGSRWTCRRAQAFSATNSSRCQTARMFERVFVPWDCALKKAREHKADRGPSDRKRMGLRSIARPLKTERGA